ncbi:putative internal virion protein [Caudoviricetes sp.]|nr:putative internal virion protein [Caudoviricetes sp.]
MADIQDIIRQRAIAAGVDPTVALTIARIESNFDPTSNMNKSTQYKGLFQLGKNEWANNGAGDVYDPAANTDAFLKLYNNNSSALGKSLGRAPTPQEAYLAHQQGVTGATALLNNPDKNAVDVIAPFYKDRATAISAIKGNGGNPDGTAGDFVNMWSGKYDRFAKGFGGNDAATATASVDPNAASAPVGQGANTLPLLAQSQLQPQLAAANAASAGAAANGSTASNPMGGNPAQLAMGLLAAGAPKQTWSASAPAAVHQGRRVDFFQGLLG